LGIGGIKPYNIKDVIGAGATGVAVISGVLGEADIKAATGMYMKEIERTLNHRVINTLR